MSLTRAYQSLTIAGKVAAVSADSANPSFQVRCRTNDVVEVFVGPVTNYMVLTNLDGLNRDRVPAPAPPNADGVVNTLQKYIKNDISVVVQGIYYSNSATATRFEARTVHLMHYLPNQYLFEETHWWLMQISQMADKWLDLLFDARRNYQIGDFSELYRTNLNIQGMPTNDNVQECATLSRLIYGLSSAYLLTGSERYYMAARAGVQYQREAFRSLSHDGQYCFWQYGRRRQQNDKTSRLIIASENHDDEGTIPLYEQIYAIAGLAQYYRVSAEWEVLDDIRRTVNSFQAFYHDEARPDDPDEKCFTGKAGYFSHLDPATMRPDSLLLDRDTRHNRMKKNWNSVGDHIPAYLVNLILALDPVPKGLDKQNLEIFLETCRAILDETSKLIVDRFPDPSSKFVNERFLADWTPDHDWDWQLNRAIVGHNLKIAWNLTRCANYFKCREKHYSDRRDPARAGEYKGRAAESLALARRLANDMAEVGLDRLRGGVFDAVERNPDNGMPTEFVWGTTKDFWQQEQGILAYLILHGADNQNPAYLEYARELMAFWNLFFLDRERQGVFFRTTENGLPYVLDGYGLKAGHAVAGYHSFELNFLAHLYIRNYVVTGRESDKNFCLYFKISPGCVQETINVLPDFFAPGQVQIKAIRINGADRTYDLKPQDADCFQIPIEAGDRASGCEIAVEFEGRPV